MATPMKQISWILIALIVGSVILGITGLLNNNFYPKRVPTEIILTKSPLQVTYKGNNNVDVIDLVKQSKDFPFVDYKFNEKLKVTIDTTDAQSASNEFKTDVKTDIKESTHNGIKGINETEANEVQ